VLTFSLDGQSLAGEVPLLYEGSALYLRTDAANIVGSSSAFNDREGEDD